MNLYPRSRSSLALTVLFPLLWPLAWVQADSTPKAESGAIREFLERSGAPRIEGRLILDPRTAELRFARQGGAADERHAIEPGDAVSFEGPGTPATAIPPMFQVVVGESARLSGSLREVSETGVQLSVPWQAAEVRIARPGVQAVIQRAGEARILADGFQRLDPSRWSISGSPEVLAGRQGAADPRGLKMPAGGTSLLHRFNDPPVSGRLELSFHDDGTVVNGQQWVLELTFRGAAGPLPVRGLLGWTEETLAVESPGGPALAVQRLIRGRGWHRLGFRFGPDQTEIAVDGKELAHGKGPAGPLVSVRIATVGANAGTVPKDLAGYLGEIQVVRFAEPPASLEIDVAQDEARLVVGDQLYGTILSAGPERVVMTIADKPATLDWSEVSGLYFRRVPAVGAAFRGTQTRVEWLASSGNQSRDLDFAEGVVTSLTETSIILATPYAGTLTIPRERLRTLRVLSRGWRLVIDPAAHHLGDNISTTPPLLDPPLPEGGILDRSFDLTEADSSPAFLVLDVVGVVGETSGTAFSNLVLRGELRTYLTINGKRIDYLNRYITTNNETPERVRVPIPPGLLKRGKNQLRIELTGIANDPTWFDDLGILQIALEVMAGSNSSQPSPAKP